MKNNTTVKELVLLGLTNNRRFNTILFVGLLIVFLLTLMGNVAVVTLSLVDHRLQTPVYFFLQNFSLLEICFSSVIVPRYLYSLLTDRNSVPLPSCFLQLLVFFLLGTCVFFHVALMSFDCYVAICHPLCYDTIMSTRVCSHLVLGCWGMSFLIMFPPTFMIVLMPFCGPSIINHFYRNTAALLQLACTDTAHVEVMSFVVPILVLLGTLMATVVSYICIIWTILHIPSASGRTKAFSTCSAHLLVVIILYSSAIYIWSGQRGAHNFDKVASFLFCVVVQLFNPYIYALRNEQVKGALKDVGGRAFPPCMRLS